MGAIRELLRPFGRTVSYRLRQLEAILRSLSERLQTAVAEALGRAFGSGLRDALREQFLGPEGLAPWPAEPVRGRPRRGESGYSSPNEDDAIDLDLPEPWTEGLATCAEVDAACPLDQTPLQVAVRTGLRIAGWLLRALPERRGYLGTTCLALMAGAAAYLAPDLARTSLELAGSAGRVNALADGLRLLGAA